MSAMSASDMSAMSASDMSAMSASDCFSRNTAAFHYRYNFYEVI